MKKAHLEQVLKLFIDLNWFTFQSEFVMKWIPGKNLREVFASKNPRNPKKLQGYVNKTVGEKYWEASLSVALNEFYSILLSSIYFLNCNILAWIACHCWPLIQITIHRAQHFHAFALLNKPTFFSRDKLFSALIIPQVSAPVPVWINLSRTWVIKTERGFPDEALSV